MYLGKGEGVAQEDGLVEGGGVGSGGGGGGGGGGVR